MTQQIRTLVAGLATVEPNTPPLPCAVRLADRASADLHLVHAFELSPRTLGLYRSEGCDDCDPVQLYEQGLKARLEGEVRGLPRRARVTCHAVHGSAAEILPRRAAELHADLLVLAHTRRGKVAGAVLGTTAQRVLRASPVPVLVLRETLPENPRVLLTTDLSPHAGQAHARGVALAEALAAPGTPELRSLFVTHPDYALEILERRSAAEEGAERELREFLREGPASGRIAPHVRVGDPAREIVAEAGEWGADLLVLGTHARTGVRRLLLGSVAETVLRSARCSVLVLPSTILQDAASAAPSVELSALAAVP